MKNIWILLEQNSEGQNIEINERKLLSLDGYDDYGKSCDSVSILTLDEYRRFHKYIGNCCSMELAFNAILYPSGVSSVYVECVCNDGNVSYDRCNYTSGVRPVLILKSSTLVGKDIRR